MFSDGNLVGDGSWELCVLVTDLNEESRTLRVKGDRHIGGVMLQLVEDLGISIDWSDHALWWPDRNIWLTRTRFTLDQYGVQADALLYFTPVHKILRVQLPDRRILECRVDYSIKTFNTIVQICKELGIRYPEELSFAHQLISKHLKQNYTEIFNKKINHQDEMILSRGRSPLQPPPPPPPQPNDIFLPISKSNNSMYSQHNLSTGSNSSSNSSIINNNGYLCTGPIKSTKIITSPPNITTTTGGISSPMATGYMNEMDLNGLANSPQNISIDMKNNMIKPKNLLERARINVAWLDSSLSIMEQGVREFDILQLRFKFYSFYDLNPKYDNVRINQLYEQAKWQLLNEEIDCTEEEMLMFASLQLQITLQANVPQQQTEIDIIEEDDIDAALNDLQITLEGGTITSINNQNILRTPELSDILKVMKPKKYTLKGFKKYHVTCRDLYMNFQKNHNDTESIFSISLRGCETIPDVNLSQKKYGIKLEIPGPDGISEYWIRCDSEEQYARWMSACKLGSKGKSLADSSYENEVKNIKTFLSMQHRAQTPAINPSAFDIKIEDFIALRFLKKIKGNKLTQRILEGHANVKDYNLMDAKMNYIKGWQSLPDFGITLFIVRFTGQRKDELLAVTFNRIIRMDINNGDHIKTWRYNSMKAWNVNWEVKMMMIQLDDENISFSCLSADCKVVHEFIGGYIFLSIRSKDASQTLNDELFHKLTGGWS